MTDAECDQSFDLVSSAMRRAGLDWVVTQLAEQIRFGKPATKRVQTTLDDFPEIAVEGIAGKRKITRETFAFTRDYTAHERLSLLLDALERAVIVTSQMEGIVRDKILGRVQGGRAVRLIRTDEPGRDVLELGATPDIARDKAVHDLHRLVEGLRARI